MRLQLLRNLEFWQSVGYKSIWTQSSLLVTFVYKPEIPVRRLEHHAQSPANTASVLPQTLLFQLLCLEFEMRFDLRYEVILFALSPEHRVSPPRPRVPEPARWPPPVAATWSFL